WGKRRISAKLFTSLAGFQPAFLAQSSQKGQPVSGEKCHCTISRTRASSFSWAVRQAAERSGAELIALQFDRYSNGHAKNLVYFKPAMRFPGSVLRGEFEDAISIQAAALQRRTASPLPSSK